MEKIEVIEKQASGLVRWAETLQVKSAEEYKIAVEKISAIKALRKTWTDYWKPLKEKAYSAWQEVCKKEKQGTDILDRAKIIAEQKALSWKREEEARIEKERLRLQAEAEERARREKERLEKQAEKVKSPEKKEALIEQAQSVQVPIVSVQPDVPKVEGMTTRVVWKAELVSLDELIKAATPGSVAQTFLMFNQSVANNFARSTKGTVQVPGVKFYKEEILVNK